MKAVWWGLVALSVLALAGVWSVWGGRCVDGADFGYCTTGPAVGWPGAVVISALSVGATIVAIAKLRQRPDRTPTWTGH